MRPPFRKLIYSLSASLALTTAVNMFSGVHTYIHVYKVARFSHHRLDEIHATFKFSTRVEVLGPSARIMLSSMILSSAICCLLGSIDPKFGY